MSVLRSLEEKIAGLVEGTFGRVFRSEVRPVELAHKLAKEMDEHRTVSVSRTYVPNEYVVWLSPDDRERYVGVEASVIDELAAYLLEHARREHLALVSRPQIEFRTDDRLALGEFGIQARLVNAADGVPAGSGAAGPTVAPADMGHTMIYSTSDRHQQALSEVGGGAAHARHRAIVVAEGKRLVVPGHGATIGRSRECDIVLTDSNVSRRHAEIAPSGPGWLIRDLGSTNGLRVNGRQVDGPHPLESGDQVEVGTVPIRFEVE
jgi:hypothetical protein